MDSINFSSEYTPEYCTVLYSNWHYISCYMKVAGAVVNVKAGSLSGPLAFLYPNGRWTLSGCMNSKIISRRQEWISLSALAEKSCSVLSRFLTTGCFTIFFYFFYFYIWDNSFASSPFLNGYRFRGRWANSDDILRSQRGCDPFFKCRNSKT